MKTTYSIHKAFVRFGYRVRMPLSRIVNLLRSNQGAPLPFRTIDRTIEAFATWFRENAEWERDELKGMLDTVSTVANMWGEWSTNGVMKGDCDDLATVAADMIHRLGYGARIVTITPKFSFRRAKSKRRSWGHVIAAFLYDGEYRVFSNNRLQEKRYSSLAHAARTCFYPKDAVIMYEVRSWNWRCPYVVDVAWSKPL